MISPRIGARLRSTVLPVALALALGLSGGARAEDVSERAKVASGPTRLRGASGVRVIPGGLLSLGGGSLRFMPKGAREWRTVHAVPGDSLYRVDADERGRVLAVWEKEPLVHLLDLETGAHRTFPKPPDPPGHGKHGHFSVSGVYFAEAGRAAIVFVGGSDWAYDTGTRSVTAAYRVALDGEARPELLFSEEGHPLHASGLGAAFVKPKSWRRGCSHESCSVETILALELAGRRTVRRTIFEPGAERVDSAQIVRGTYADRFAVQVGSWDGRRHRRLLRYTYGKAPTLHELSDPTAADSEDSLLGRNGDYVEARQNDDRGVTITRLTAHGEESSVRVTPWADASGRPARDWFHSLGERADGSLWLHWGNQLVVGDLGAPRKLEVGQHLGRGTEWAKVYVYDEEPERLWIGVEVGGGRDYAGVDLADADRRARPWQRPTVDPNAPPPMPPSFASRPSGSRREVPLPAGVLSIGDRDLYYRKDAREDWRLLYAVPGRSIYRIQVDDRRGRVLAHWSSERTFHLFEPARGVHRTFPWPSSEAMSSSAGLTALFFAGDDRHAVVYMCGHPSSSPWVNEAYRVRLDANEPPALLFRAYGNYLDLSEQGGTFALPTKQSAYHCDTTYCIVDRIVAVTIDGDAARERVVYQSDRERYTDYARSVWGKTGDERGVVVRYSLPREEWATRGRSERALLRFRYGAPGVEKVVLPAWTTDAVKRMHLTESGDYLEFVVAEKNELLIELLGKRGARATWRVPAPRHAGRDSVPDRGIHGFGERRGGGYWLHWGDHVLLLGDGQPVRAASIARHLKPHAEWASADRYTASPESLRVGVDLGAGREFVDVPFAAIEKGAVEPR